MDQQVRDFMARVVPWATNGSGHVGLHWHLPGGPFRDCYVSSVDDFLASVERVADKNQNMYFCLSQLRAKKRIKDNATYLKSLWLDVDVKKPPKGYTSLKEALKSVRGFTARYSLPHPSAVVCSGGGIHVYWFSNRPLTVTEWSPYAAGLKAAAQAYGLRCDAGVTTDAARVLRVPGTRNFKTNPPREVRIAGLREDEYDFSVALAGLLITAPAAEMASGRALLSFTSRGPLPPIPERFRGRKDVIVVRDEDLPPAQDPITVDPAPVLMGCAFLRNALETGGDGQPEPLWYQTIRCATALEDGNELAHKFSKGDPRYSYGETEEKWEHALEAEGWPHCATLKGEGAKECASCPHWGKIKSPINLGWLEKKKPVDRPEKTSPVAVPTVQFRDRNKDRNPSPARGLGADFEQCVAELPPVTWSAAELKVSFLNIPHRRWLYGTYLIRGEITVLAAPGGAGKTALATGIAIEIATSKEKLGEKVWKSDDGKVLYVNGEDSGAEIQRRLWAFCQQHKLGEQDLVRLYVAGADGPRVQSLSFLCVNDKGATALNEEGFNVLESALQSLRPDLLVLDPLVVFCGGGNMNDNSVMSLVMRKLKALAVKYDCAILVVHHTRKGGKGSDTAGEAESVSGAAAIVNLARRALMPVTMTEPEMKTYGVLPSQRRQYFKLADAKSNLAPLSAEAPWYELASEELPNAEPPIYPNGDRVQAVKRAYLTRSKSSSFAGPEQLAIRFEFMKLVDRGLTIDGEKVLYSPNSTGNNKKRAILDDAMAAVEQATPDREWLPRDLRVTAERELEALKHEGWIVVETIKKGRFRRCHGLQAVWERTPWAKERKRLREHGGPTVRTGEEEEELEESDLKKSLDGLHGPNGSIGQ
jgi:AAA domain